MEHSPVAETDKAVVVVLAATGLAMGVARYLLWPQLQRLQAPARQALRIPTHLSRLARHHARPGALAD